MTDNWNNFWVLFNRDSIIEIRGSDVVFPIYDRIE